MSIYRVLVAKNGSNKILIDIPCRSFPDQNVSHIASDILKQLSSAYNIPPKMSILFSLFDHKESRDVNREMECALVFDTVEEMDLYSKHYHDVQQQQARKKSLMFSPVAQRKPSMLFEPSDHSQTHYYGNDKVSKHYDDVDDDEYKQPLLYDPPTAHHYPQYDEKSDEQHGEQGDIGKSLFHQLQQQVESAKRDIQQEQDTASLRLNIPVKQPINEKIQYQDSQKAGTTPTSFNDPISGVLVSSVLSDDNQRFTRVVSSTGIESYSHSGQILPNGTNGQKDNIMIHPDLAPPSTLTHSPSASSAELRKSGRSRDYTIHTRLPTTRDEQSPYSPEQFTEHVSTLSMQLAEQNNQLRNPSTRRSMRRNVTRDTTSHHDYTPRLNSMRLSTSNGRQNTILSPSPGQSPVVHYQKHFAKYCYHYFFSHNLFYVCISSAEINQDGVFTMLHEMKHHLQQDLGYVLYHITNSNDIRLKRSRQDMLTILTTYGQEFNWKVSNYHHTQEQVAMHPSQYDLVPSPSVYLSRYTVFLKSFIDLNNIQQLLYSKQMCGNITPTPIPSQASTSYDKHQPTSQSLQDKLTQAFIRSSDDDVFGDSVWRSPQDDIESPGEYMLIDGDGNIIETQQRRCCRPFRTWHLVLILVISFLILGLTYLGGAFACGGFSYPQCR